MSETQGEPEPTAQPTAQPAEEHEVGPGAEAPSPDRAAAPVLSIGVGLFCVAVFLYALSQGEPTDELLTRIGAPDAEQIWGGAVWGLLTSNLVHVEPIHLLANLSWVWTLACVVERRAGRAVWVALLVGAGLASSGAQLVAAGQTGIGISGVVYAWAGFAWAARSADRPLGEAIAGQQAWLTVWLVVCFGATQAGLWNVANAAHLAGLVFGLVAGHAWAGSPPTSLAALGATVVLTLVSVVPAVWAPWSAAWWYQRGVAADDAEDDATARDAFDAALARDPRFAQARWRRAFLRWDAGDLAGAEEDLSAYLEEVTDWAGGYEVRAQLREQRGRHDEALADHDAAVRLEKSARRLLARAWARQRMGRLGDGVRDCDEALPLAVEAEQRREVLDLREWQLEQLERFADAARDADALAALSPDDLRLVYRRGKLRLQAGDARGGEEDLRRVADGPDDDLRADALETLGAVDAALAVAEGQVAAAPDDPGARRSRGWLRFLAGDLEGARADYEVAAKDPDRRYADLMLGLLAALAGDPALARSHLEREVERGAWDPYPALWVAGVVGERGHLTEHADSERPWPTPIVRFLLDEVTAEALFAAAAEAPSPRRAAERLCEAHAFVALAAERAGDLDRAREHYRRCLEQGIVTYVEHRWARARLAQLER